MTVRLAQGVGMTKISASAERLGVVTKMDKENAAYEATVDALREAFSRKPIAVAVPIGAAEGFRGYVDLVGLLVEGAVDQVTAERHDHRVPAAEQDGNQER